MAAVDEWVDRGVGSLLREALLVHKAAQDASASISELVSWCMDSCSTSSLVLAALWAQLQAHDLPPRLHSFYSLLMDRLAVRPGEAGQGGAELRLAASAGGSWGHAGGVYAPLVMCSSVGRTAVTAAATAASRASSSSGSSNGASNGGGEGPGAAGKGAVGGAAANGSASAAVSIRNGSQHATHADEELPHQQQQQQQQPGAAEVLLVAGAAYVAERAVGEVPAAQQVDDSDTQPRRSLPQGGQGQQGLNGGGAWHGGHEGAEAPAVNGAAKLRPAGARAAAKPGSKGSSSSSSSSGPNGLNGSGLNGSSGLGAEEPDAAVGASGPVARKRPNEALLMRPKRGVPGPDAQEALHTRRGAASEPGHERTADAAGTPAEAGGSPASTSGSASAASAGSSAAASAAAAAATTAAAASAAAAAAVAATSSAALGAAARAAPATEGSGEGSEGAAPAQPAAGRFSTPLGQRALGVLHGAYVPVRLVPTGQHPLVDVLTGQPMGAGISVPPFGALVISNDPRVFPGCEAHLPDYATRYGDKLAMRLEHIVDRSSNGEVSLQLFNISRVQRKRTDNCRLFVNGEPVNVGDPGVMLLPGDEVWFGGQRFSFRVEALPEAPAAVADAVERVVRPGEGARAEQQQQQQQEQEEEQQGQGRHQAADAAAGAAAEAVEEEAAAAAGGASTPLMEMRELANLSKRDPAAADAVLRGMAAANPGDAAVWLLWGQLAARESGPAGQAKARVLFRAAVAAARTMPVLPPMPPALEAAARLARGGRRSSSTSVVSGRSMTSTMSDSEEMAFMSYDTSLTQGPLSGAAGGYGGAGGAAGSGRHNWLLVQALSSWAKHEWRLRMYGTARHLFRAAVDESALHPDGLAGGGGGAILHYWASQEFEALNVRNARIVVAEACKKCPNDAASWVLAASIELEAGNLELAKQYSSRAYAVNRQDKQLYLVWPRVEAALGDRDKARLLYERGLEQFPFNTKIMNHYARFFAEEGSYQEAAELFDRALSIDPLSAGPGVANRCAWASMEADLGNTPLARQLLVDGLQAHPRAAGLLVTLAKVERLDGRYGEALELVRRAQALAGAFNMVVLNERAQVLRALGEEEMAANLARHAAAVGRLNRMKQQGYWGSEAWRAYVEETRSREQRQLVAAARERRLQLGWVPATRLGKPSPTGVAGQGRTPRDVQELRWAAAQGLQNQRREVRRLVRQHAAAQAAAEAAAAAAAAEAAGGEGGYYGEDGEGQGGYGAAVSAARGLFRSGPAAGSAAASMSSSDEEYDPRDYYEEEEEEGALGVPTLERARELQDDGPGGDG